MITLLTDYGLADEFVGVLHGVIARIAPGVRVIDVSHGIAAGDVAAGARVLARAIDFLPTGVHVAVVDPGVGGERRAVALGSADGRSFVGPDNGVLIAAADRCGGVVAAVDIGDSPFVLRPVSATFHGRDIFAPVAAALATGEALDGVGRPVDRGSLIRLPGPVKAIADGVLQAEVVGVDGFGNVELAAGAADGGAAGLAVGEDVQVRVSGHELHVGRMVRTFAEGQPGELLLLADSGGQLALALFRESAARALGVRPGDVLELAAGGRPLP
jgi:S-adenosylmethionine hydrolase